MSSTDTDADMLRLLIDSSLDYAIFMLDPQGYVTSWNAGAQRIKGYRAEEIIGRHFSVFYPPEVIERGWPEEELRRAQRDGRFEDEGWRLRKDGSRFFANVIISALRGPDGELRGFAKVTRDISERRANEQRIHALTQELERRVHQLAATNLELKQQTAENESFVYSVSHDLRAPLVNLQGFSQELMLSMQDLQKLLDESNLPAAVHARATGLVSVEMEESIAFIRKAVRHLGNIIDGLLRLSRVGRVEYKFETVQVGQVVGEILDAMHSMVSRSGARVAVTPLPSIMGDRNAIGQVFANIIGNALKSFDPARPGELRISVNDEEPPVFAITDNGVGIPADYHSKIFQVFQHVHAGERCGEGMGLAIVKRIVERHNGRIWFESKPDVGTTFYFVLGSSVCQGASKPKERI